MKKILSAIFTMMLVLTLTSCSSDKLYRYEGIFNKLNTVIKITLYYDKSVDIKAFEKEIVAKLDEYDREYDAYNPNSTLSKLNASAYNNPVVVSETMFDMIKTSIDYAKIYPNTYDPTIHPLALLWGIDENSYFAGGTPPTEEEIKKTLEVVGYDGVVLDEDNHTVMFTKEGMAISLGSVVKGYIVDDILLIAEKYGIKNGIIDAGSSSQVYLGKRVVANTSGKETIYELTDQDWRTGISKPFDIFGQELMGEFACSNTSTSSSGIYRQYYKYNDKIYHHILDPKTGYPVDNGIEYVQVFTNDYKSADILSTMLFCVGLEDALDYMNTTEGVSGFIITKNKIYLSKDCPEITIYPEFAKEYKIIPYE